MKPVYRWTAGRDGIAHAHTRARSPWTLCNRRAVPEQTAHPARERCSPCQAIAEGTPIG